MEKGGSWDNRKSVIRALSEGMELANELKNQLHSNPTSTDHHQESAFLLQNIVSCYDNAILQLLHDCMPLSALGTIFSTPTSEVSDRDSKDQLSKDFHMKERCCPEGVNHYKCVCALGQGLKMEIVAIILGGFEFEFEVELLQEYYFKAHQNLKQKLDFDLLQRVFKLAGHITGALIAINKDAWQQNKFSQWTMTLLSLRTDHQEENFPSTLTEPENVETQFFSEEKDSVETSFSPPFFSPAMSESCFSLSPGQVNNFEFGHNFLGSELDFSEIVAYPNTVTNSPLEDSGF
ncbi:hypothetical protein Sango_1560100 [Sesamum angolense]|uniref:Uncharacterized protein n=1 Tax=Sesamum angolense TaxID=2727404 RepID=A0AAE2BTQ1_9LAMI|nr:hypothetical protein Sango_1560100 [Sesamum angolense]